MNRLASWSLSLSILLLLAATACSKEEEPTSTGGDRGRVHFAFTTARSGAGVGPVDKPLMVGAEEGMLIVEDDLPGLFLRSSNPSVIAVACKSGSTDKLTPADEACPMGALAPGMNYDFMIHAFAPGEAVIELWTTKTTTNPSALYETIHMEARSATRVVVDIGGEAFGSGRSFDVKRGESFTVSRRVYAGDAELQGSSGISLCTTNPAIVSFPSSTFGSKEPERCTPFSGIGATAIAAGSTSITASAGNLGGSASVHVR